jgi:aryl-alcohol dehydrogenase-like predicted oxidoreductase
MQYKTLGTNGPVVSAVGLGCMSMSGNYEAERDDIQSMQTILGTYKLGVNFFDTADVYGNGRNETLVGQALHNELQKNREKIIIATKCGFVLNPENGLYLKLDLSAKYIKAACEASLKRLQLDYIDVYYLHRPPAKNQFEESLQALVELLTENKIRYVGLSEATAENIRMAHTYFANAGFPDKLVAIQSEFSLLTQDPLQNDVLATCDELGISFVPYSPLSRALLAPANKINVDYSFDEGDFRAFLPRFQGENFKSNLAMRDELVKLAETKNCSLPQLALAWIIAQGKSVIPIPGSRQLKHITDNIGAINVVLTQQDLAAINNIVGNGGKGLRYSKEMLEMQNIEH